MKKLLIFFAVVVFVIFIWAVTGSWEYNREEYVSNKVLDNSMPFDVRIDTEFLKDLRPANESSRTSSEGL